MNTLCEIKTATTRLNSLIEGKGKSLKIVILYEDLTDEVPPASFLCLTVVTSPPRRTNSVECVKDHLPPIRLSHAMY